MIDMYTNQTAVLKVKTGVNDANEAAYAPDVSITCRIESTTKMIRNKLGQEVLSVTTIFTKTPVKVDDVIITNIMEFPVISVSENAGLNGQVEFYEVSL